MPYGKTPTEMKDKSGMMMKDQGQPMMKHGKGPKMSAELAFMPAVTDMIGGRASSIVNAGARSRMSGQPQMGHKGSPAGMHGPLHKGHEEKEKATDIQDTIKKKRFNKMIEPKMTKTITKILLGLPEEQLKATDESIKKSEAQELQRIKRK